MTATSCPVLIVGGGLSGLVAALELQKAAIPFLLIEARERLGGRILSVDETGEPSSDAFDLGPSWFWPGMQEELAGLASDLGLAAFAQFSDGDSLYQKSVHARPQRFSAMPQSPPSMRLEGGTGALVSALAARLPPGSCRLGTRAVRVQLLDDRVLVQTAGLNHSEEVIEASRVLFAVPPRLLEHTVEFSPPLEAGIARLWRDTPTWMAPHAKFFAIYDRPFWRDAGLSGDAHSMIGPLGEIHDATTASGKAALFGFVGVPSEGRTAAGREVVIKASLMQLEQLFGPDATSPRATLLKDWAADPLTATPDDQSAGGHPHPHRQAWVPAQGKERVALLASETSLTEPGYLAGAVEAARRVAGDVARQIKQKGH